MAKPTGHDPNLSRWRNYDGLLQALISDFVPGPQRLFTAFPKIVDGHTTLREFCFLSTGSEQRDCPRLGENVGRGGQATGLLARRLQRVTIDTREFTTTSTYQIASRISGIPPTARGVTRLTKVATRAQDRMTVNKYEVEDISRLADETPFRREWKHFANCILEKKEPRTPLSGGLADLDRAIALIQAMPLRDTVLTKQFHSAVYETFVDCEPNHAKAKADPRRGYRNRRCRRHHVGGAASRSQTDRLHHSEW
jgi:hypothetical protein